MSTYLTRYLSRVHSLTGIILQIRLVASQSTSKNSVFGDNFPPSNINTEKTDFIYRLVTIIFFVNNS